MKQKINKDSYYSPRVVKEVKAMRKRMKSIKVMDNILRIGGLLPGKLRTKRSIINQVAYEFHVSPKNAEQKILKQGYYKGIK